MTLNSYKHAPLPFVGQKRNFLKHFESVLRQRIPNDGRGWTVVDVFGGSGLLAHTAKRLLPQATVIYNDFDGYADRLTHIDDTNRLRQMLWAILQHEPRSVKLAPAVKAQVLDIVANFDGFVDVQTLAGWLLFSGRQVGNLDEFMAESTLYNRIVKSDYDKADGYLDGLIVTCESFDKLLPKYQDTPNCLLILDPPYLCTTQSSYNLHERGGYFGMTKFLELMQFVRPPYVFFSSTRSELLDYMAYLAKYEPNAWERVGGFERLVVKASVNRAVAYEDNLIFRF